MINQMLYIAGPPGVGKSLLARTLTSGWDRSVLRHASVPHSVLSHPGSGRAVGLELGVPREDFPGTDALAMDIGPRALEFLLARQLPFALGEGSRLATRPFLGGLVAAGVRLTFVSLSAPQDILDQRWRSRGSKQNTAWRKGAFTRSERMYEWALAQQGVKCLRFESMGGVGGMLREIRTAFPLIDLDLEVAQ
jgi:hypothetical protein